MNSYVNGGQSVAKSPRRGGVVVSAIVLGLCISIGLIVACSQEASPNGLLTGGGDRVTKEMTSADFELRPEFGMLAGEFPGPNSRPGYGYHDVPMHFRVWVDEFPLASYSNVGLLVTTTDPEGVTSTLLEEFLGFNQGEPGGDSALFMLEGLEFGSRTHFFITADELIEEEVMHPFHFHTVMTVAGPVDRVEVVPVEDHILTMAGPDPGFLTSGMMLPRKSTPSRWNVVKPAIGSLPPTMPMIGSSPTSPFTLALRAKTLF